MSLLTPAYTLEVQVFNEDGHEVEFKWCHKITRYLFNEAKKHYENHGHAMAKIVTRKAAHWKFDREMVRSVIIFVLTEYLRSESR